MKIYKVGGAVRDSLLGLPVKDQDWVVVGATPEQMVEMGYKPVGKDFPVFLHPESKEEYALARTERKTAPGYRGFVFNTDVSVTLEQDLKRRDLTINAMAEEEDGSVIDYFNGQQDLDAGILRHVSDAFVEDPLRVLRVARFASRLDFEVAGETMTLMRELSGSGELSHLAPERIWSELESALASPSPRRFIEVLRECGALEQLFPEIDSLFGVPQPEKYHPEIDSGVHTLMVLDQACLLSDDAAVRFAALMHDLGKATTPAEYLPGHRGHEERSVKIIEKLCDRFRVPNRYRELARIVARYHLDCHRAREMRADTIVRKLEEMDAFRKPERFRLFLLACKADIRGRLGFEEREYPQADFLERALQEASAIDTGKVDMQGLEGKEIANRIRALRVEAVTGVMNAG